MENFLPFLLVIAFGIIKAVTSNKKEQEKKQQQRPVRPNVPKPRPTVTPSEGQHHPEQSVYKSSDTNVYVEGKQDSVYTSSKSQVYVEEEQRQMERLKNRMNVGKDVSREALDQMDISLGSEIQDEIKHHSSKQTNLQKEKFKKHVKTGLNRKGLVNGIIMSEVLGPPRARKPYRNVIKERRRHY